MIMNIFSSFDPPSSLLFFLNWLGTDEAKKESFGCSSIHYRISNLLSIEACPNLSYRRDLIEELISFMPTGEVCVTQLRVTGCRWSRLFSSPKTRRSCGRGSTRSANRDESVTARTLAHDAWNFTTARVVMPIRRRALVRGFWGRSAGKIAVRTFANGIVGRDARFRRTFAIVHRYD